MSKRFGRNQRRKLREEVASLTRQRDMYQRMNHDLHHRLDHALTEALHRFMDNRGLIEASLNRLVDSLGARLGDELRPHAEKILESTRGRSPVTISVEASAYMAGIEKPVWVLRGRIAPLAYNIAIMEA